MECSKGGERFHPTEKLTKGPQRLQDVPETDSWFLPSQAHTIWEYWETLSKQLSCPQEAEAVLDTWKRHKPTEAPGKYALQPVELREYAVCSVFPAFMSRHPCRDKALAMQLFGKIISVPLKNPHKTCWRLSILWSVVGSLLGVFDTPSHLPDNSTKLQFPNHLTLPVHTIAKTEGRHTGPTYRNPCSSPFTCGILI